MPALDANPALFRYAWFTTRQVPNLCAGAAALLPHDEQTKELSELGKLYKDQWACPDADGAVGYTKIRNYSYGAKKLKRVGELGEGNVKACAEACDANDKCIAFSSGQKGNCNIYAEEGILHGNHSNIDNSYMKCQVNRHHHECLDACGDSQCHWCGFSRGNEQYCCKEGEKYQPGSGCFNVEDWPKSESGGHYCVEAVSTEEPTPAPTAAPLDQLKCMQLCTKEAAAWETKCSWLTCSGCNDCTGDRRLVAATSPTPAPEAPKPPREGSLVPLIV